MKYLYNYRTQADFSQNVSDHIVRLRIQPCQCYFQNVVEEHLNLPHQFWWQESVDAFGNKVLQGGMRESHSSLQYSVNGIVEHTKCYVLPDENPHAMYRMPSALTSCDSAMLELLPAVQSDFLSYLLALAHNIHSYMHYVPSVTNTMTTANEAFKTRSGVCQDYAHLMVALCRHRGFAARYVCGFIVGEGATHAWVEVHDGNAWYAFDPTNDTAVAYGYVKVAHGRDAADCMVNRGRFNLPIMYSASETVTHSTLVNVLVKQL